MKKEESQPTSQKFIDLPDGILHKLGKISSVDVLKVVLIKRAKRVESLDLSEWRNVLIQAVKHSHEFGVDLLVRFLYELSKDLVAVGPALFKNVVTELAAHPDEMDQDLLAKVLAKLAVSPNRVSVFLLFETLDMVRTKLGESGQNLIGKFWGEVHKEQNEEDFVSFMNATWVYLKLKEQNSEKYSFSEWGDRPEFQALQKALTNPEDQQRLKELIAAFLKVYKKEV